MSTSIRWVSAPFTSGVTFLCPTVTSGGEEHLQLSNSIFHDCEAQMHREIRWLGAFDDMLLAGTSQLKRQSVLLSSRDGWGERFQHSELVFLFDWVEQRYKQVRPFWMCTLTVELFIVLSFISSGHSIILSDNKVIYVIDDVDGGEQTSS